MEKKYGMVINLKRCIGCHTCSIACKAEHNIPKGSEIACVGVKSAVDSYCFWRLRARVKGSHGRNAGYPAPPAQIPSMRNYRTGLLPRVKRRDVDLGKGVAPVLWESISSSASACVPR
jgi:ferredoxin